MAYMFMEASSFNQPLNGWNVAKVTDMEGTFQSASAFNQPLGDWSINDVTSMANMFVYASSFDQNLGWCVDNDVTIGSYAFTSTACAAASCGVVQSVGCSITGYAMTNTTIREAVTAWLTDPTTAVATYGHISTWGSGGVTDMRCLFSADTYDCDYYNSAASSFNDDISAWDTSGVTSMFTMFNRAAAFNQPLNDWNVDEVKNAHKMFYEASSFNQDLGWCVDDDVNTQYVFYNTQCESTSCGVTKSDACQPASQSTIDDGHHLHCHVMSTSPCSSRVSYFEDSCFERPTKTKPIPFSDRHDSDPPNVEIARRPPPRNTSSTQTHFAANLDAQ